MTIKYLVAYDGECLCNPDEETVTFTKREAEAAKKHLKSQSINAEIIKIQLK